MTSLLCSTLAGERAGVGEFDPLWFPPALSPVGWMSASCGVMNRGPGVGWLGSNPSSAQKRCPWRRGLGVSPGTPGTPGSPPSPSPAFGAGREGQGLPPPRGSGAHWPTPVSWPPTLRRARCPSPRFRTVMSWRGGSAARGAHAVHSGGTGQSSGDGRAHRVKMGVGNAAFTGSQQPCSRREGSEGSEGRPHGPSGTASLHVHATTRGSPALKETESGQSPEEVAREPSS